MCRVSVFWIHSTDAVYAAGALFDIGVLGLIFIDIYTLVESVVFWGVVHGRSWVNG
jgi:hypothetical protein